MRKTILSLLLLLFVSNLSFAQEPVLTKKQMYKDFDQLVKIIENCNPQLPVRKAVTGFDNLAAIKKLRKNIDTVNCYDNFYSILNTTLNFVMDGHTQEVDSFMPEYDNLEGIDTFSIRKNAEYYNSEGCKQKYWEGCRKLFPIKALYHEDNYYFVGDHYFVDKSKDTLYIHFMKLISYNGQNLEKYVEENCMQSYEYKRNTFYTTKGFNIPSKGLLKGEQDGKIYELNLGNYPISILCSLTNIKLDSTIPTIKPSRFKNKEVKFFDRDSILYIYLDRMNCSTEFYDKVKEVGKGKKINKVIIDVRDNPGGSDYAWHNLLTAIIKDSIPFHVKLAYCDSKMMDKFYGKKDVKKERLKWLDNKTYRIMENNWFFVADSNSLNYDGKIYILENEKTFSAAHSLTSYANQIDKIISVGYPTGQMVGLGVLPTLFQLKYSKFTFRLITTIDITNCEKPIDVYQDFPEIEVYPTLEEHLLYPLSGYDTKSEKYLYKYDSMFKKVLELI